MAMEDSGMKELGITRKLKKEEKGIAAGDHEKVTVKGTLKIIMENINANNGDDNRPFVTLGHGDPSFFPCFRISPAAEDSVVNALRSARYNGYPTSFGLLPARKAVADYISRDLPFKLLSDDVYLTAGCKQAIQAAISSLALPDANILMPRPGYPTYGAVAALSKVEVRYYDLLPEQGWEVDLNSVEALADDNTVAIVLINPGNPSGSVYSYQHLEKLAETARKLGLLVISDEVFDHLTFGTKPFVRMGVFASKVPVLTLGSMSKRWLVPGWRIGWLVPTDPNGFLEKSGLLEQIKAFLNVASDPPAFIQAALPDIIENMKGEFFSIVIDILRRDADIVYEKLKEIPQITCPHKPEGSMVTMVRLNISMFDDIKDDVDFCIKLGKEEKVIVLPGSAMGMKNWLRITFAVEPSTLEEGLQRIKAFCERRAKD